MARSRPDFKQVGEQTLGARAMLGILAFGSLINDPGEELEAATKSRKPMMTPFRVEFARFQQEERRCAHPGAGKFGRGVGQGRCPGPE